MANLILILKGLIIGIGKIIPGVSGSLLAFSLGVYESSIKAISNFFKDIKNNLFYLGYLAIGIVISILLFSKLILIALDKYYLYTIILFMGLIVGTIPQILKKVKISKKRNLVFIILAIVLVLIINYFKSDNLFIPSNSLLDYLYIILIGFIDATTMIIPGISGTATFMMLGCYNFVLNIFSNPFFHFGFTFLFIFGLILGIYLISKLTYWLIKKHQEILYLLVIGFTISTIIFLMIDIFSLVNLGNIISVILLFCLGFIISYNLENLGK